LILRLWWILEASLFQASTGIGAFSIDANRSVREKLLGFTAKGPVRDFSY
jgi:hypothetical protein